MKKIIRYLAFGVLACFGMISILATSQLPPPVSLDLISENDPWGGTRVYACPNDQVVLKVDLWDIEEAIVLGEPKQNTIPELNMRSFIDDETIELTVLDALNFLVVPPENYYGVRPPEIKMLPTDICEGLPYRITGVYQGQFSETVPSLETLDSQLFLQWREDGLYASFEARRLKCQIDSAADSINCEALQDNEALGLNNDAFSLNALFTETGFTGTYKGTTTTEVARVSFEGTLEFIKVKTALEEVN